LLTTSAITRLTTNWAGKEGLRSSVVLVLAIEEAIAMVGIAISIALSTSQHLIGF